ncbi:GNAT family N-acetyltransferase [Nocardioides sp. Soil805]|uniref:GNAT family N-acetyltransferase n=1 Tax=Nocardioides sp. Soil805 TaxID=1736416 RepID=UPI000A9E9B20|nr:GNAT family N-acetyltransferase [Nocardioides sp. Soil805]
MTTERVRDDYEIDSDPGRMDVDRIHHWLSTDAFWAIGRTRDTVADAARNSLNFGVFAGDGSQVAYARVITDRATFAWLCDVYVDRAHRGRGLGSWLAEVVVATLRPMGLKRVLLSTRDAHEVYARVGFEPMPHPEMLMVLGAPDSGTSAPQETTDVSSTRRTGGPTLPG